MQNVPICLLYGREDPWVKPIWGQKVKQQVPEATYYEMSPAGHCPHDEVPEVCNMYSSPYDEWSCATFMIDSSPTNWENKFRDVILNINNCVA